MTGQVSTPTHVIRTWASGVLLIAAILLPARADAQTPITCGQTVSGIIGMPGEQDTFTFSGIAGERVIITVGTTSGDLWPETELVSPTGTVLASTSSQTSSTALPTTGTYTIRIRDGGTPDHTGSYNLNLQFTTGRCGTAIACGQTVSGTLDVAQANSYTFSGTAGERIVLTVTDTFGTLDPQASLFGPTGSLITDTISHSASTALPTTGTYTVIVADDWSFQQTGGYNLGIQFTTGRCGTAIACGQTASANLNAAENDSYTFSAIAGERVVLTVARTSGTITTKAELYGPTGAFMTSTTEQSSATAIPTTGTYTIVVKDYWADNQTGGYNITLQFTTGRCGNPITCGQTPTASLMVGETDSYLFSGNAGERVVFSVAGTSGTLSPEVELYGPTGLLITTTTGRSSVTTLPTTGTYTVLVNDYWSLTQTGGYSFNLQFATGRCGFGLAHGQTVSGAISAPTQQTAFVFCGMQGSSAVISIAKTGGTFSQRAELYDPSGALMTTTSSQSSSQVLSSTGTYTVLVRDNWDLERTGTYNLGLTFAGQTCPAGDRIVLGLTSVGNDGGWMAVRSSAAGNYVSQPWARLPWSAYNTTGKGTRVAAGDVDGDGRDELVIGLESGGSGWIAILDDAASGFALMQWIQVPWPSYNAANGEVWPAVGDIDGDGRAEIVAGLGQGAAGWFAIFEDASTSFAMSAWRRVGWSTYNAADGRTYPAIGNVDGIGGAEIIIGLGPGSGGWIEIFSSALISYSHQSWIQLPWPNYNAANGETHVAAGDLDGDGRAEIVAGLGAGGYGWFHVFDDASASYASMAWRQTSWPTYNANASGGQTYPAVGDIDGDPSAEIVLGLGPYSPGGGWFELLDDGNAGNASLGWRNVDWPAFLSVGGGLNPAIGRFR